MTNTSDMTATMDDLLSYCVLFFTFVVFSAGQTIDCATNKADIVFLLDASTSQGTANFNKQLEFVANFTKAHTIGPDGLQVGIVTFSTRPHNNFYLNTYSDKDALINAIHRVPYSLGDTYTNEALKYVRQNSFLPIHGARNSVPNILVVMTDGESTNPTGTINEADLIHNTDIKVIAIGIGSHIQTSEINAIASGKEHAFTVPSFDALQFIETKIQRVTCITETPSTTVTSATTATTTPSTTTTQPSTTGADCANSKADIIFLLDSSTSEGEDNFKKQLDFVGNFTKDKEIGADKVQIGIVTFSSTPRNAFNLNTYSDKTSLIQAIHAVRYMSGDTYTNEALKYVRQNSFLASHGARSEVPKILVVMTDGESTIPTETIKESALIHDTYVKVIAIGIGSRVQPTELNIIASDREHVFTVPSFDALQSIEKEIQRVTCITKKPELTTETSTTSTTTAITTSTTSITTSTTTHTTTNPVSTTVVPTPAPIIDCSHNKADIVFLLDSSTSEGQDNFRKQLNFVENFTKGYDIGPDAVQVGIVTFSNQPHNVFYMNKYHDRASLIQGIQHVPYYSGDTYTDLALKYVRENSFLPVHGARYGVPKILVVMTDGESTRPTNTVREAKTLHYTDLKVIAIGIGNRVNPTELRTIATDSQHAFTVPSFDSLQTIEHEIQTVTCISEKIVSCDTKKADIVFALHASGAHAMDTFRLELELVWNITNQLTIGPNNMQVSLVVYGSQTFNQFFLNSYSTKSDILTAIQNASYISGLANTPGALEFVRDNSFKTENGGRVSAVTKLAVFITDKYSNMLYSTQSAAASLHHTGVKVISVGIGHSVSQGELAYIASNARHVFTLDNITAPNYLEKEIENVACTSTSECGDKPADVVFILDCSANEGQDNFQKMLDFMSDFVRQFDIGPSDVQVSLITIGSSAHTEFYLNKYNDRASMISAIQSSRYWGGGTDVNDGLHYAGYHFSTSRGARPNATKLVILLTQGNSRDAGRSEYEAQLLKNKGVKIVTVGIGGNLNQYELMNIATDRSHMFSVGSFDILHTVLQDVTEESCKEVKTLPPPMPKCGQTPADIVFLLDASSSEGRINFHTQLDFVRDFLYQFEIGPNAIQVSVVVFSTYVKEEFSLNRYHDQKAVLSAISRIPFLSGASSTDRALAYVRTSSFLANKGDRQNAKDIVILLTDGRSGNTQNTQNEAQLLKQKPNMTVITIGIGSAVDRTELQTIATDLDNVLTVPTFNDLPGVKQQLTYVACQTCDFLSKADVVFALATSSDDIDFHKVLDFVSSVVNDLNVGANNVHVGVVTMATKPQAEFNLNTYINLAAVLSEIQKVGYPGRQMNITKGLKFVNDEMFSSANGDRHDAPNYLIIITDNTTNRTSVDQQIGVLMQKTKIITVGIGSRNAGDEALGLNRTLTVATVDDLSKIQNSITANACEDKMVLTS